LFLLALSLSKVVHDPCAVLGKNVKGLKVNEFIENKVFDFFCS
jgi:hypothetical protein